MAPRITTQVVPTGGAIALNIVGAVSGVATLMRTASGEAAVSLYTGTVCGYYLDIGDKLPSPLKATTPYQYAYTDATGTTTTDWITPNAYMVIQNDPLLQVMIRLIQAACDNVVLPTGVSRPQVSNAMPMGGQIPLPLVVVSEDLIQQAAVPIGQSVPHQPSTMAIGIGGIASGYTIIGQATRTYRVSVLAKDVITRDFFRDLILGMFNSIYGPVLQPMGVDVTHRWQATTGQIVDPKMGIVPGFYYSELMLTAEGTLNVSIYPQYGTIETVQTTVSGASAGSGGNPAVPPVDIITVPIA